MKASLFTDGWNFTRLMNGVPTGEPESIRLPHDAMLAEPRSADAASGNHGGYFPGGVYRYTREWLVPADAASTEYRLRFEGVYGDTSVSVNGTQAGDSRSPYRSFTVPLAGLEPGSTALIQVDVDNTALPNSRWYTGAGIYRRVWLEALPSVRISDDGVRIAPTSLGADGVVNVDVFFSEAVSDLSVLVTVTDDSGVVAVTEFPVSGRSVEGEVRIPAVRPWSAEDPHLYTFTVELRDGETVKDTRVVRTGLRTVSVDATRGLRINGAEVKLRGACVHHDNGVLGAATLPAAEYRRAKLLKQAGYNAIRSSHNPLSASFLDACDELGLYVLDELTDIWFEHKTPHDRAERFHSEWQDDAREMVREDRNRPSVIMYSIGNENAETATSPGVNTAREVGEFVRKLDPTRPVTAAINLLLNMAASFGKSPFQGEHYAGDGKPEDKKDQSKEAKKPTSTQANAMAAQMGKVMQIMSRLPQSDKASREVFGQLDVAGYNYAYSRYKVDRKKYPDRVILGSESMPGDLPQIWKLVKKDPGTIGDFMWTGWDYLGESGIGTWAYGSEFGGINKPYPALLAGTGAFDITGLPGAPALLAQAVWGQLDAPAIAVRPLDRTGQKPRKTPWRTSDAIQSWAWGNLTGTAEVEVYSSDDEVELFLNSRSLGRKKAGERKGFVAKYKVPYEPGELVAVGYRGGRESGRSTLTSAGPAQLTLRPESTTLTSADDLSYVWVELADEHGTCAVSERDEVTVTVTGAGTLAGFGSANPITEESYVTGTHTTFYGRALAIIRGTGTPGEVTVTATSKRRGQASVVLTSSGPLETDTTEAAQQGPTQPDLSNSTHNRLEVTP